MKLVIDYDMLNKIKYSKKGFSATDVFFRTCKKFPFTMSNILVLSILAITLRDISLFIIALGSAAPFGVLAPVLAKTFKDKVIKDSCHDLDILALRLNRLNVKTTGKLLQNSEILESELDFKFVDSKPLITKKTYIKIPLSNDYEETILQEHKIGSKNYELSVQEPVKKKQFKLAKSAI